jgi:chemotaxis protein MotB
MSIQKKYVALEDNLSQTKSMLTKTQVEKEELEGKFAKIEARVAKYNSKRNSLKEINDTQHTSVGDVAVMSNNTKANIRKAMKNVHPAKLALATTLQDSMNLAVS